MFYVKETPVVRVNMVVVLCGGTGGGKREKLARRPRRVELLLKHNPRPLIVSPSDAGEPSGLLVAYDDSLPASRALQLLALLNMASGKDVHVLSVAADGRTAERAARHAVAYLQLHGVNAVGRPVVSEADPAEVIIEETKAVDASMLVMGAYGHRGWRDFLLGSCTTRILSLCPATLFILQ